MFRPLVTIPDFASLISNHEGMPTLHDRLRPKKTRQKCLEAKKVNHADFQLQVEFDSPRVVTLVWEQIIFTSGFLHLLLCFDDHHNGSRFSKETKNSLIWLTVDKISNFDRELLHHRGPTSLYYVLGSIFLLVVVLAARWCVIVISQYLVLSTEIVKWM